MTNGRWSKAALVLFLGASVFIGGAAHAADAAVERKEAAATTAARAWLALVDDGKYAESWGAAADLFRKAVGKEQWVAQLDAHRKPLGKVAKRVLKTRSYATSLPGAPNGEYVVLQYETTFDGGKKDVVETVTPMVAPDGSWRVSGYFIK